MMQKHISSQPNIPKRRIKIKTRFPSHHPHYDTEEVSPIDEYKGCLVVFADMLKNEQKIFLLLSPAEDMKSSMCIIYHNETLS